jgi:3',5'-cyclic AMP phosphodiesterase CpdA
VLSDGSEFLIHTGDLVPSGSTENWQHFADMMKGFTLPFFPMPGNHELLSNGKISSYLKFSGAPTPTGNTQVTHYSFDRGALHFTIVDSSLGSLLDSEFAWMDNDLASSNAPIKMVFVHHPPFDPAGTNHVMTNGGDKFMQIAKLRGAKYIFAGHIHCYEEADSDGVKLIITGGGGAPLSCLPTVGGFYHYVHVAVHGEQVAMQVVKIEE